MILGIAADKYNRSKMLFVCTLVFAIAIVLQGQFNDKSFDNVNVKIKIIRFGAELLAVDCFENDYGCWRIRM